MGIFVNEFEIIKDLEDNWIEIRKEYETVVAEKLDVRWHETFLYEGDWNVFGLIANYQPIGDAHNYCKKTAGILKKHETLVRNAGFSILKPNTVIHPHKGYSDQVLRCHLGIQIPDGDCHLNIEGKLISWQNGKAFIFDDTCEHSAWNKTALSRIVFLLDLDKELLISTAKK